MKRLSLSNLLTQVEQRWNEPINAITAHLRPYAGKELREAMSTIQHLLERFGTR